MTHLQCQREKEKGINSHTFGVREKRLTQYYVDDPVVTSKFFLSFAVGGEESLRSLYHCLISYLACKQGK